MVKGVSRSVIEINNTGDGYVERAILFINPERASAPGVKARAYAYLKAADADLRDLPGKKRRALPIAFWYLFSFLLGAGMMATVYAVCA